MPTDAHALSLVRQVADLQKRMNRHSAALNASFDVDPVVIGHNADGSGFTGGVTIGAFATTGALDSTSIGYAAGASGSHAIALGPQSRAIGDYTIAIGNLASASGTDSVVVGSSGQATGNSASAFGLGARADGDSSTAVGVNAHATLNHQIMLGTASEFVEIPGNSSTAPNGLVLTDTATSTRYIIRITSGALVLSAAP